MKAFQISRNARTTSSTPSGAQSSNNEPSNCGNRAIGSNDTKQKQQSPASKFSPSPQFKTAVEKFDIVDKATSDVKNSKATGGNQKIKQSAMPQMTWAFPLDRRRRESAFPPKPQTSSGKNNLGFPCELPNDLIEDIDLQAKFGQTDEKVGVIITKSLLVLRVEEYSIFYEKIQICDFLTHLEDEPITSKKGFYDRMKVLRNTRREFNLRLRRPLWNTPAARLPKGYDRAPGYNYIRGLMILYPGANLGMNVKAYNNKVYVTSTDQMSIASATCLMGDCIIEVDGIPITSTASCGERVISGLKRRKFVLMTIERAVDVQAIRVVKFVLLVEKIPEKDPRMAQDTTKIGLDQAERIRRNALPPILKSIYRGKRENGQKRLAIREMSMFTPIGADPFNPLLMQAVPPKRMDAKHAAKTSQVNIATPLQRSKD
ncbi:unnamed protein product [Litomosoides sigmodontis]|uniref:PDZ domain-containing protein n=1 Tax=Litomosoides sigmodontis TaxID=42156 RepID=A0A3P6U3D9_LITSI|nr:unnamed protein product [Litomosoides sigmodontis]